MNELITNGGLNIATLKKKYLEYIDVSDKTVQTYDIAIRQFAKYLNERGITTPTRENVLEFKEYLKEKHSVSTINSYLIALRNFFNFLEYNGIYKNITENVKGIKDTELHKRQALSVETCQKMLQNCKNSRERVVLLLAVGLGLRANEIVNIRLEDFKKEENTQLLYVLGKGRAYKQDYVVVPNEIMESISEYIKEYKINDYLIISYSNHNFGGKVETCTIRRMINAMYEREGIKTKDVVLHSLRHSFATISIENGVDIRDVQKAMRHKSLPTTERYLHDIENKNNKCTSVVANNIFGGKNND